MQNHCSLCGRVIIDGQKVQASFQSRYRALRSAVTFALHEGEMEYVPHTLRHIDCEED